MCKGLKVGWVGGREGCAGASALHCRGHWKPWEDSKCVCVWGVPGSLWSMSCTLTAEWIAGNQGKAGEQAVNVGA